jgi:predicted glycosyltransferase
LDIETKRELVKKLGKYATVFISSEAPLPKEFEKYRLPISIESIHDFLFCAKLLVCDSQTMTTEAGVLGTPAIRCNSFVGENDMGNFIELEQKYGLIFNYNDPNKAINKAVELIQEPNLKEEWRKKREKILKDKIDITKFMLWFIENYPESFLKYKEGGKGI